MGLMRKLRRNLERSGLRTLSGTRASAYCNECGREIPHNFMTDGHRSPEWCGVLRNKCSLHGTRWLCPACANQGKYPWDYWGKPAHGQISN